MVHPSRVSFVLTSSLGLIGVLLACSSGTSPETGGPSAGDGAAGGGAGANGVGGGNGGVTGGAAGSGATGSGSGTCTFTVSAQTADKSGSGGIPTVGIVEWSVDATNLTSARVVFALNGASESMTAPVDVADGPSFRTLLLGMKASKTYAFHIEVSDGTSACTSPDYSITTGALPSGTPSVTRTAGTAAASQAKGFILASSGTGMMAGGMGGGMMPGGPSYAYIVDADGDVVWVAPAPPSCSRAQMSYDAKFMWMLALNVGNSTKDGGEVRRVSMDGLTTTPKVPGLSNCHHDFTVLPDGRVACPSWVQQSGDQPSDLIESDDQGNVTKVVTLDSKVYLGGQGNRYHANAIHYHPSDDSYTIGDRNPNLFVKVSHQGEVLWQFGGSCTDAPAPRCVAGDWSVNHGHDLLPDGTFVFFNNGQGGPGGQGGGSAALFYRLTETGTFAAEKVGSYAPGASSGTLGDVLRLPNGNTLVAFSNAGEVHEIDVSGALVQMIKGPGGYIEWRESLYSPPPRL